jgi:hypothetical protein
MCLPQTQAGKQRKVFGGNRLSEYRQRVEQYNPETELREMQPQSDDLQKVLCHCLEKREAVRWQAAKVLACFPFQRPRPKEPLKKPNTMAFTEDDALRPTPIDTESFLVELDASSGARFGIRVSKMAERRALLIEEVSSSGLFADWNSTAGRQQQVTPGCEIVEVVGHATPDCALLREVFMRREKKCLRIRAAPLHPVAICCPTGVDAAPLLSVLRRELGEMLAWPESPERSNLAQDGALKGPFVDASGRCFETAAQARSMGKVVVTQLDLGDALENMGQLGLAKCILYSPTETAATQTSPSQVQDEQQLAAWHRLRFAAALEQADPLEAADAALQHFRTWFMRRLGDHLS